MTSDAKEFQVPVEAMVFLAAVGGFVVLLFVFFLYLNKSLCFTKCSGLPCDKTETSEIGQTRSKKLGGTFEYDDPADETSSDSDDEVMRRYQQTMMATAPRPSTLHNINGNRDAVPRPSIVHEVGKNGTKINSKPTGIATYLRRDEKVRSYNSEGVTNHVMSDQATTKFIIGGEEVDDNDDDVIEVCVDSVVQGRLVDKAEGEDGGPSPATDSKSASRSVLSSGGPDDQDATGGAIRSCGGEEGAMETLKLEATDRAYENKAFTMQQIKGDEADEDDEGGDGGVGGRGRASARQASDRGVSLGCDTVSNVDHEENLFDVGDFDDRHPILISKCGSVNVTFHYNATTERMSVAIHEARDIPSKDRGGAHNTQVRLLLLPTKKNRHKTKIKAGECPKYDETFSFKVPFEDMNSMGLRIRLYGCERMRRERMIGEHVKGFATLALDAPVNQWLALEPRSNLSHGDSKTDIASLSRSDSGSSNQSMQHGGMPELLIGLSYNGTTGRLSVQVIKGSNFKNMAMARAPDTYVKLTMMSPNGQEITRSKTSIRRGQPHPLYKETFMFQVPLFQLPDVTLMVSVFYNRSIKRKEMIGWFSLGYSNSSDEELSHWTDMRESKGEEVCRWHVLLEP